MPSRKASKQNYNPESNTVDPESPIGVLLKMFVDRKINQQQLNNMLAVLQLGLGTVQAPEQAVWNGGNKRRISRKRRGMKISRKLRK